MPSVEYFNVTVVDYPHKARNYMAYSRNILPERESIPVNGTLIYDLVPEDPDGDDEAVVTEFEVLSDIPRNICRECFVWNPRSLVFVFHAKEELAGYSIRLVVKYTDDNDETSTYPFMIEVDSLKSDVESESDEDSDDIIELD